VVESEPGLRRPSDPPDVFVVVMDCVRAADFPGGGPSAVPMPFVERLRSSSVSFPRAVSVAPWTLPSHASLFTGLYPWEHGCHGRGSLRLDPRFERLAQTLQRRGYRTASLSGNPIISPFYGLADGFELSEWGEWWEQVDRVRRTPSHAYRPQGDGAMPEAPTLSFRDRAGRAVKTMMTRYPATLALADAAARRTVDPGRTWPSAMNPWIETDLAGWLGAQPRDRPTFVFLNTIDAHEPYLLDPADAASVGAWWNSMRIPQDVLALLASETPPSPPDLARLHELYRQAIGRLDRRIERWVRIYQDLGRWENTLFLLTSDHGQAFGEHGMIWHGVRTDEEMLRIPLMMRWPGDEAGGTQGTGWASPMDVPATVLDALGAGSDGPGSGRSLASLVASERPGPLYAAGDGTEWNRPFMAQLSPRRQAELNLFSVAAYRGTVKVVVDATSDAVRAYDLRDGGASELPSSRLYEPELAELVAGSRRAAEELLHPAGAGVSSAVDDRLRSWGYG
jgi:arylsulfatase A-like enzyme